MTTFRNGLLTALGIYGLLGLTGWLTSSSLDSVRLWALGVSALLLLSAIPLYRTMFPSINTGSPVHMTITTQDDEIHERIIEDHEIEKREQRNSRYKSLLATAVLILSLTMISRWFI